MKVIISGGGTGGHVYPAIAIANALKAKDSSVEILFVGAKGKLEMDKVPKAGFDIEGLWISGLQRKLTLRNLMFPFKLVHSLIKSKMIIKKFKPDVAVGVGGYASGPLLEMATRSGIPTLIQEQNSYAGMTNKLLAKKVNKICVAYDQMQKYFPAEKIIQTGNPVRQDILDLEEKYKKAISYFDLDLNKKTILIFGGSLGARALNVSISHSTISIQNEKDVQLIWQVGKLYADEFGKSETAKLNHVKMMPFIERMDLAYSAADLVICRAGALTISELCLVGKPAILVPSPNVSEDHQTKNANALVDKGAALMMQEKNGLENLFDHAIGTLKNKKLTKQLSDQILKLGKPDAATRIAEEIMALAEKGK
jgi:UDP-N-acetylglucosamine--N-acetylmuramyl-(pentapeptide) pyrophosphoryl-undecaprenol N-acetylglucosamine transferase